MNQATNRGSRTDWLLLSAFCGFLFFYGLGAFGLVGADEPRYAQVAREMLERADWITPTLLGKAWLEKPVLYYWEAMVSFRAFGVNDWAARLPAAFDAALLIAASYFFLRRFRPGSELDGALILASSAGMVGFAHAAATDMPLSACFAIALLGWYAWYEGAGRVYLGVFYVFLGLGTLAKGPVAPALAAVIIFLFVAAKREWRLILRTLWIPGIAIYLAVALPWYVAVQLRNPDFFRFFILEHNLARFSTGVYHHPQPFWFFLPVFLLAMMPWTFLLVLAIVERGRVIWSEGRAAFSNAEDSWPLFLLIWMFVPILFFSASQSKLPGYILPAVPAGGLLVAEFLAVRKGIKFFDAEAEEVSVWDKKKLASRFVAGHGMFCGALIFGALSASFVALNHRLPASSEAYGTCTAALVSAFVIMIVLFGAGLRALTRVTALAVVICVAAVIRSAAPVIDATQSARPIAESIQGFSREPVPIALYHINRLQEYGLEFYLNRAAEKYESGNIPVAAHVLVAPHGAQVEAAALVPGRHVSYLTSIPGQKVDLFWVGK
jgi:4-amino-4-deoxy-L-arabinose transferase-like glycosyltransferase